MYAVMLVIIWKGNTYYKAGDVSIGTLSTFVLYLTTIAFQFFKMSFVIGNLFMVFGAAERLTVIIGTKPTILTDDNDKLDTIPDHLVNGELRLEGVKFRYPTKPSVVALKGNVETGDGVSLGVSQDNPRVIALVGASGCGKSTCIALMERFYDPLAGRVTFCGRDIRELENRWYRKNVSIVQ